MQSTEIPLPAEQGLPTAQMTTTTTTDRRRNIRHQTALLQQEGEQTFILPAPLAPRWSKKETKQLVCKTQYMQFISFIKLRKNITFLLRSKLLSLDHYIATPIYIYNLNAQGNERNVKPPLENKTNSATLPAGQ